MSAIVRRSAASRQRFRTEQPKPYHRTRGNLNEARALKLLEKYPSAIKRPVVEAGAKPLVGFDSEEFALKLKA